MGILQVPLSWACIPQSRYQGHTTSPVIMGIPQSRFYGHTTSPVTNEHIYHSPVIKGIPQVPLLWAYHKSRYQGHTISPETRVYHIEYRYSSCFSHVVFYRFNKADTIIIIIEYGVYGLASGVVGECCFTAPSATRI